MRYLPIRAMGKELTQGPVTRSYRRVTFRAPVDRPRRRRRIIPAPAGEVSMRFLIQSSASALIIISCNLILYMDMNNPPDQPDTSRGKHVIHPRMQVL